MDQGTIDWLKWRQKGIGGSDVPAIMGVSPWCTPYGLWVEKTASEPKKQEDNFIFQKGHQLEIQARNKFEIETGKEWRPRLVEHSKFPHYRASLDGFNEEENAVWECKYMGKDAFSEFCNTLKAPEKYYPQIMWQLFVTGASVCYLTAIDDLGNTATAKIYPNITDIEKILNEVHKFWNLVQINKAPKMTDRDVVEVDDSSIQELFERLSMNDEKAKELKKENDELKKQIESLAPHKSISCNGFKMTRVTREGNIQWKKVPEISALKEEYLDSYRSKASKYYKFSFPKAK